MMLDAGFWMLDDCCLFVLEPLTSKALTSKCQGHQQVSRAPAWFLRKAEGKKYFFRRRSL